MDPDNSRLVRTAQRDVQSLKVQVQRREAPNVLSGVRNALRCAVRRVQRARSSPAKEAVCFATVPAPCLLTDQPHNKLLQVQQPRILRCQFTLPRISARVGAVSRQSRSHTRRSSSNVALAHREEDEDDLDDEEDEDDDVDADEDDDVSLLSWHMLSSGSPVRAEPVSEGDEQLQFDTIAAGNVPTVFVGRAYTNGAVNVMALQKMQKLLVCILRFLLLGLLHMLSQESVARYSHGTEVKKPL